MNELQQLSTFEQILAHYTPSQAAQDFLKKTRLVLLLAASASGRNTIIGELIKTGKYHYIISDTTRMPRVNNGVLEQNGREYWFRGEGQLLHDLQEGLFLEAEVIHKQQVSGISIRELEKAYNDQKVAITDIDLGGVHSILAVKPDTLPVVILPPSFTEWQRRIRSRGSMPEAERKHRLETAVRIFQAAAENHRLHLVVNSTLQAAVNQVDSLVNGTNDAHDEQLAARQLARQLYEQTVAYLQHATS